MNATPTAKARINVQALVQALQLESRTHAEMVEFNPRSGDYRVFDFSLSVDEDGNRTLNFDLYRQAPGFQRRIFRVLTLTFSAPDAQGLSGIEAFHSDAGMEASDVMCTLPTLGSIVAAIHKKQRPKDEWILPFLSRSGKILWTKALLNGGAA